MLRKLLFIIFAFLATQSLMAQSGELKGKVLDKETREAIPFANVVVELNGNLVGGSSTDFDGNYTVKPIPAGKYTVKATYVGYKTMQQEGVVIRNEKITFLDLELNSSSELIEEVEVVSYKVPLISKDQTQSGSTMTSEEIEKMPGRSAAAVSITVAGVYSENGEVGSIRGARSSGNVTYVDGVKVIGSSSLPQSAIEEVSVITGGVPAKYGDVTGGVTNLTTKGPSNKLFGGAEGITSHFLDPYDYNLIGLSISGPLVTKQNKEYPDKRDAVVGYIISGEFQYVKDPSPSAIPLYRATDEVRQSLIDNPLRAVSAGFGANLNAEYLHKDAFEKYNVKRGDDDKRINVSGKIDFKPTKNTSLVLGGSYLHLRNNNWSYGHAMFNEDNFGESFYDNWRMYLRFTQKFPDNPDIENPVIKNAYYTIQADYEETFNKSWDKEHKDNLFNYGYIGKYTTYSTPYYSPTLQKDSVTGLYAHLLENYFDTLVTYERSEINPEMGNYMENYFALFDDPTYYRNLERIQNGRGLANGDSPDNVYGMWALPGQLASGYSLGRGNQFRISASGSADIKNHAITIGFEFEQRTSTAYNVSSTQLWQLGRNLMNKHIAQLDLQNPIIHYLTDENGQIVIDDFGNQVFSDTISYNRLYSANDQSAFDINFRKYLGLPVNSLDWVDVDKYDPSDFDISYFSADELLNSGNSYVGYLGYDVYGNRLTSKPSLQDFFTKTTQIDMGNGTTKEVNTRERAPYEPTYAAAYIQDKFAFNDLVFNVGLRVDRFDANQMVLKDPYTLYETYKVGDDDGGKILNIDHPDNIGEGYVVYVDNLTNPTGIMGYRSGDTWYDAKGTEIDDPELIASANGIRPYLVNPDVEMTSENYEVSQSFEDYKPQITVMPRISFSFPISDVALFFAHYDVLSTRPGGINISPIDYLFMKVRATNSNILTNPNMKPEKTIDYELGFKQKIGNTSAITLSAFYREMRDMQQAISVVGAYPVYSYLTYGNIDFGTVKGFTMSYDLRRTGNIALRASYTLQFANGTGSTATEGVSLLNSGQPNLRATIPLDFDQRHSILGNVDFRFASGKLYNGPKLFGKDILQNTGANMVIRAGSGSPYTKRSIVGGVMEGSWNGSRKPWRNTIDIKFDRDIMLSWGEGESKKRAHLNVYIEIMNILDKKNIINVYSQTGNPSDNGFLLAAANQPLIESTLDPEAYRNYYTMNLQNPGMYSRPRTIRLGVSMNF
ncbi:MAG: TonB-dependent receptor [Bacteroidales bacterium]|nr:TonB-dependent receptor [Bacteroidales bacterium]MCF8457707.1 TonB-dependent receptor [Bacteroidales bacterium]